MNKSSIHEKIYFGRSKSANSFYKKDYQIKRISDQIRLEIAKHVRANLAVLKNQLLKLGFEKSDFKPSLKISPTFSDNISSFEAEYTVHYRYFFSEWHLENYQPKDGLKRCHEMIRFIHCLKDLDSYSIFVLEKKHPAKPGKQPSNVFQKRYYPINTPPNYPRVHFLAELNQRDDDVDDGIDGDSEFPTNALIMMDFNKPE